MKQRKIIHVDMDAFYASVEVRDNPSLVGKPVVVGGSPTSRAVVCSASYEARKFGIRSAMACSKAKRMCPHAIFVFPHFERYSQASREIHSVFETVTDLIEPLSLDEAYLDVTENKLGEPSATRLAMYIRNEIKLKTKLTASAGVGPNKLVAKIASDFNKPDGLTVVRPDQVQAFLDPLPVERLWGVGAVTKERLSKIGLIKVKDIREASPDFLESKLGNYGKFLFEMANGIDDRRVESEWDPKSRGSETTFDKDTVNIDQLIETLKGQAEEIATYLDRENLLVRTVTLKVKYHDFKAITRSKTLEFPFRKQNLITDLCQKLLNESTEAGARPIRLIGVSVSHFIGPEEPMQLWFDIF